MKNRMSDAQDGDTPSCPWSKDCERLADVLDGEWISELEIASYNDDDARLIRWLRTHISNCSICRETLMQTRQALASERSMLREYLQFAEAHTPSATASIMDALRKEARDPATPAIVAQSSRIPERGASRAGSNTPSRPVTKRSTREGGWVLALVAALIVLSFGFLSNAAWKHLTPTQTTQTMRKTQTASLPAPPRLNFTTDWSSVVAFETQKGQQDIDVFDPIRSVQRTLLTTHCDDARPDAIAHSGKNLLYHCYDGQSTIFHLLTGQSYRLEAGKRGDGGDYNAVWSTDDSMLFIALPDSLVRIDIAQSKIERLAYTIQAQRLLFYYDDALYFSYSNDGSQGTETQLKRLNLKNGSQEILAHSSLSGAQFWLRPDGQMFYYTSADANGQVGIYAIGRDGGNTYLFSQDEALVGFDAYNVPMVVRNVQETWQLISIDSVSQEEQTRVVDIAPGAEKVSAQDVLLSPYSRYLVVMGQYLDGSQRLWFTDLATGQTHDVNTNRIATRTYTFWLGWSKIQP
ncbi:hypothetical protein [Ktedonospora formicarum]|uniref:Uncharacterized protein n=1 Tax=Ktedonospora formicarum TaxID=2778364 RepID=A0A8J3HXT0_9CHLR|nr:hypothetical protein [Ktedonospora formicarum]GHO45704.1 hypothetical protein KSX_38670 [Ktedonospora formicarum]